MTTVCLYIRSEHEDRGQSHNVAQYQSDEVKADIEGSKIHRNTMGLTRLVAEGEFHSDAGSAWRKRGGGDRPSVPFDEGFSDG